VKISLRSDSHDVEGWIDALDAKTTEIGELPIDAVPALQSDVATIQRRIEALKRLEAASGRARRILNRLIIRGPVIR